MKRKDRIMPLVLTVSISLGVIIVVSLALITSYMNGSGKVTDAAVHSCMLRRTAEEVVLMQEAYNRQAVTGVSAAYFQGDRILALLQCYVSDVPGKNIYGSKVQKITLPRGVSMNELKSLFFYNKFSHSLELLDTSSVVVADRRK